MTITIDSVAEDEHEVTATCAACDGEYPEGEVQERRWRPRSHLRLTEIVLICDGCADGYGDLMTCAECDSLVSQYDTVTPADHGEAMCEYCYEVGTNAGYCEGCDQYFYYDPCEECGSDSDHLHDYSYRPRPVFHGTGPTFFGVELEMEAEGSMSPGEGRDLIAHHFDENRFYVKHDGSLNNGLEMVSMPMSLDAWREMMPDLRRCYADLVAGGFRGWRTGTAGLHVHVSDAAFHNKRGETNEAHLWRFLRLYYTNATAWQRFAGRSGSAWAQFDVSAVHRGEKAPIAELVKTRKKAGWAGLRYMAWNLTNKNTYEGRMFRASINADRVLGNIESIHAAIDYTRNLNTKDVHNGALRFDVFAHWLNDGGQYPAASRLLTTSKAIGADN
jgi:hypothetical protein